MVATGAVISIVAGAVTALVAVFLTFYLRNKWQEIQSLRAIQTELEQNVGRIRELAVLLEGDLHRQQVDLPVEVPPGTTIEIRYIVSFPSSLSTTAFEQLKHTGMFLRLPPEIHRSVIDVYDRIDRINRLREHRERIQFSDIGNVHIVIEAAGLDIEAGETAGEEDLSPETREQLDDLRRMRRAMKEVNRSILQLIASICPPEMVSELPLESFAEQDGRIGDPAEKTDLMKLQSILHEVERKFLWSRFM